MTENKTISRKHWFYQIIPPSLMLSILFATRNGTSLVFLTGIFVLPVLISFLSILFKLLNFKKRKYFLIRPLLTISFFILILGIAHWSYSIALKQVINEATRIHQYCNENLSCPLNPVGWEVDEDRIKKNDLGFWLKYSASYYYDKESFDIRVYQGPDMGDTISGGINIPFKVERYKEG